MTAILARLTHWKLIPNPDDHTRRLRVVRDMGPHHLVNREEALNPAAHAGVITAWCGALLTPTPDRELDILQSRPPSGPLPGDLVCRRCITPHRNKRRKKT